MAQYDSDVEGLKPATHGRPALSESEEVPEARLSCPVCMAMYRTGFKTCPADDTKLVSTSEDYLLGSTIANQYVIDKCVGEGAMGRVYLAHHVRLTKRRFALKILLGDLAADPTMRRRFGLEAEAASRLQHPNVVSVLDFGKTDHGLHYLVMDFIEGGSLCDLVDQGALSEAETIQIAKQICLGLTHAHEQGLVHRDFKPDNVALVQHDGKTIPKILDFGLAIISNNEECSVRLTSAGLVVGTPAYISPEQSQGQKVDQRTDLFAFGVSLYEMLSGALPFDGSVIDILYKNATTPAPPIAERTGIRVSRELEAVVSRLMHIDREKRFPNAREVWAALEAIEAPSSIVQRTSDKDAPSLDESASTTSTSPDTRSREDIASAKTMASLESMAPNAAESASSRSNLKIVGLVAGIGATFLAALFLMSGRIEKQQVKAVGGEQGSGISARVGTPVVQETSDLAATPPAKPKAAVPKPSSAAPALPEPTAPLPEPGPESNNAPNEKTAPTPPKLSSHTRRANKTRSKTTSSAKSVGATRKQPLASSPLAAPITTPIPVAPLVPQPEVIKPKKPIPTLPTPTPILTLPRPKIPTSFKAASEYAAFTTEGPLTDSKVRQGLRRVTGNLENCYESAARAARTNTPIAVHLNFVISVEGRVHEVKVGRTPFKNLSKCIGNSLKKLKTRDHPDTGPQRVSFTLKYRPKQ